MKINPTSCRTRIYRGIKLNSKPVLAYWRDIPDTRGGQEVRSPPPPGPGPLPPPHSSPPPPNDGVPWRTLHGAASAIVVLGGVILVVVIVLCVVRNRRCVCRYRRTRRDVPTRYHQNENASGIIPVAVGVTGRFTGRRRKAWRSSSWDWEWDQGNSCCCTGNAFRGTSSVDKTTTYVHIILGVHRASQQQRDKLGRRVPQGYATSCDEK